MDDKKWFKDHLDEIIRDYDGKYVSVLNGKIIAVANNIDEIRNKVVSLKRKKEISGTPYTGKASEDYAVIHLPSIPV